MQIVTVKQMQDIDRITIHERGVPGLELMERAGQGLHLACQSLMDGIDSPRVAIMCGKGNNGGDGYVLARLLAKDGIHVQCFLLAAKEAIKGDALINLEKIESMKIKFTVVQTSNDLPRLDDFDIAVDAIFGTGFSSPPKGIAQNMIDWMNRFPGSLLAVDTPSGADMDTGELPGVCVKANTTVTMGLPKIGQYFYPGREHVGNLIVHDLGFPQDVIQAQNIQCEVVDRLWARAHLPQRSPDSHKGTYGKVLVVAGSKGMTGAAGLVAEAVLRTGAGMVVVATPQSVQSVIASALREAMTMPLPETVQGSLAQAAKGAILEKMQTWADVMVIGPGLGLHPETAALARNLIRDVPKPAVVDADAINAFVGKAQALCGLPHPRVLTPHIGELQRLWPFGASSRGIHRIDSLRDVANKKLKNTLLLKGNPTLTATARGSCYVNTSGNPGMATAGSGDVLSGMIGGLLAQHMESDKATALGAFLHGLAGDLASEELGQHALIAGDLLVYLPRAMKLVKDRNTKKESRDS